MIQGGAIPESEPDKLGKQGKHLWEMHGEGSGPLLKLIPR